MVCQYSHQNQEHVQRALSKLDSRIVTKTLDQTGTPNQAKATIDERDYIGITVTHVTGIDPEKPSGPGWTRTSDQRIMRPTLSWEKFSNQALATHAKFQEQLRTA